MIGEYKIKKSTYINEEDVPLSHVTIQHIVDWFLLALEEQVPKLLILTSLFNSYNFVAGFLILLQKYNMLFSCFHVGSKTALRYVASLPDVHRTIL